MKTTGLLIPFLLLVLKTAKADNNSQRRIVNTKVGQIIGSVRDINVFGEMRRIVTYFGIPYAEPPIGNLRFRKSVPKRPFTSPFKALNHGSACLQLRSQRKRGAMYLKYAEDCLFLNVYVPADSDIEAFPVMIWIHGGGFVTGTSDPYTSDVLAAHGNVIVVTINYRLSLFGFLSTGDDAAPGNYGLWDQHLALKWVQDNIQAFRGSPEDITIFGESAGSGSVVYHCLYEGNVGLFQRAIGQSGSITASWASTKHPEEEAERFGRLLGCDVSESGLLIDCLRQIDAEILDAAQNNITNGFSFSTYPLSFIPSVDGEFIKKSPEQMLQVIGGTLTAGQTLFSQLDFLTGINAQEGLLLYGPFVGIVDQENFQPNRTYFEKVQVPLALKLALGPDVPNTLKDIVISEYTDWTGPHNSAKIRDNIVALYSDTVFTVPLFQILDFHNSLAETSKRTYMYHFDAMPSERLLSSPSWSKGANHADDLPFLFGGVMPYFRGKDFTPKAWEVTVSKLMMTMWTNFAKTGDPNKPIPVPVEWPAYNTESKHYLEITSKMASDSVKHDLLPRRRNLWLNIIPSLYKAINEAREPVAGSDQEYCEKDGCNK